MKWWDSQQTTEDLFGYTEHTQEKVTEAGVLKKLTLAGLAKLICGASPL